MLYSTTGQLIAGIAAIPGKISIAANEFYFDADKDHPDYKKLDQEVNFKFNKKLHFRRRLQNLRKRGLNAEGVQKFDCNFG
jgi:hypothetical protein